MTKQSGVTVVAGGLMITLMLGVTYTWSVFAGPLAEKFGWTQTQVQSAFSIMLAVFSLSMIPGGLIQDRKGPKVAALFGGFLLGMGFITTGFYAKSPGSLLLTYGLFSGAGVGFAYGAPLFAAVKWFPKRRGLISGIITFGFGFGSLLLAPVANKIILSQGISESFVILGFIIMIVVCAGSVLLRNPQGAKESLSKANKNELGPRHLFSTKLFWLLWCIFACCSSAGLMIIGNLATFTKLISKSNYQMLNEQASWIAAFSVGLMAVFNGCGRLIAGWASDRFGRDKVILVLFSLKALLLFTFIQASKASPYLLFLWITLIGFCFGSIFSVMPSATADFFGTKNVGVNYGIMFSAYGFGGILGPQIMAFMLDKAKNSTGMIVLDDYNSPFILAGLLVAVAALLSFSINKQKKLCLS
jgi:OFA family oxalate/formate antiporter-like MFS transporter